MTSSVARKHWDRYLVFTEDTPVATAPCISCHRTKVDGYHAPARWDRLALAKQVLRPLGCRVVGNGDVDSAQRYETLVKETGVDGVMIGRAAVSNPFIFYEIR
jgi:tRNA-dihydrouridine synthase